ncbi:MAG: AI-2E family transporter [Bacteroidales bacterium]
MNATLRNFLIIVGIALTVYLFWYFRSIFGYIIVAGVISLIGRPVVDLLSRIHIRKLKFPRFLSALLTLALIWGLVALFFIIFIPVITRQIETLSSFDAGAIVRGIEQQLDKVDVLLRKIYRDMPVDKTLYDLAVAKVSTILNPASVTDFAGNLAGGIGKFVIAVFAVTFLAFFFLKDEGLFKETVMVSVPEKYEEKVRRALHSIKNLLIRYFIGIILESTIVMIIVTIGMTIVGLSFQQALVMGLIIGITNVIPYIGPWIGGAIAVIMGIGTAISVGGLPPIPMLVIYMIIVIASAQVIDNNIVQPMIYSKSVNAHPIEIFIIIMAVGSFAGIPGMIVAVPAYTALRVFAREFFYNFGPVRKITSGLGKDIQADRE